MPSVTLTVPMIIKTTYPLLTYFLLAVVGSAIAFVLYMMLRHEHRTRKARKSGGSRHDGRHGNH